MVGLYRTVDDARRRFDEYVRLEPRLARLWAMCEGAQAPARGDDDDGEDIAVEPEAGDWCAEDYFLQVVKPRLCELVGWDRGGGPPELRTSEAYEEVHSALVQHALVFTCACCREAEQARRAC